MTMASRRFWSDERGSVLVEYAMTLPLFLILLFALIDFSQIYLRWILAEKATHLAARLVAVRPPLCAGVPELNEPGPAASQFGASCAAAAGICADAGTTQCSGDDADAAGFAEILDAVGPLLPADLAPDDLLFTYDYADLGFLGGPYVPMVTVELGPTVEVPYITPLGQMLATFYGGGGALAERLTMPNMRATLPGEDLALGNRG